MQEALEGKTVGQLCCLDKHGWNLEVDEILGVGRSWFLILLPHKEVKVV